MTTMMATTTDTDFAGQLFGGVFGLLLIILLIIIPIAWVIFPIVVWVKFNRLLNMTQRSLNNLRVIAEAAEASTKDKLAPAEHVVKEVQQ